jgi:hypothetical protein
LVPGVGPCEHGAIARTLVALAWVMVVTVSSWHGYQQLALAGVVEPLTSRIDSKVVPLPSTPARTAPIAPAPDSPAPDAYAKLDEDLKQLGDEALKRHRKVGGVVCEVGDIKKLGLNFPATRFAYSCDEPVVYTVVEPGEFEAGRGAHLRSYHWKDGKLSSSLPPSLPGVQTETPEPKR